MRRFKSQPITARSPAVGAVADLVGIRVGVVSGVIKGTLPRNDADAR